MTFLDTSLLIDALTGPKRSAAALRRAIQEAERILLPTLVLYEWLRGPASGIGCPGVALPQSGRRTFWLAGGGLKREVVPVSPPGPRPRNRPRHRRLRHHSRGRALDSPCRRLQRHPRPSPLPLKAPTDYFDGCEAASSLKGTEIPVAASLVTPSATNGRYTHLLTASSAA